MSISEPFLTLLDEISVGHISKQIYLAAHDVGVPFIAAYARVWDLSPTLRMTGVNSDMITEGRSADVHVLS